MKTKVIFLIGILFIVSINLKANNDGEHRKANSNRIEIVKDYIKSVVVNEKNASNKLQKEEFLAVEVYVSEQGDVIVENMNFSNYFWAENVKNKIEKINIYNPYDISDEHFVLKFKYNQK